MSPNAQYELALKLPIDRLKAILQGRPDVIDQSAALLALKQKMQMKTALDGQAAQAQLAQPSIKQQLLASSGVEALPALNMEIPDGGIAGEEEPAEMMAAGGAVQRFNGETGSAVSNLAAQYAAAQARLGSNLPSDEDIDVLAQRVEAARAAARAIPAPGILQMRKGPQEVARYKAAQEELRAAQDAFYAAQQKRIPTSYGAPTTTPYFSEPQIKRPGIQPIRLTTGELVPEQDRTPPVDRDEQGRRIGVDTVVPAAAPRKASAPRRGIEQIVRSDASYNPEQQTTGPTALAALAGEPTAAKPVAPTDEFSSIGDYMKALQSYTQTEREALERAIAGRREKVEGEKAQRKGEFGGLAALGAAAELLKSGRPGATSIGEAFGSVGRAGAEYTKEERRIADQLDAADIEATKARLAMKQGDVQLGATLMGKAEERRLNAAKFEWEKVYNMELARLKEKGLSIDYATRMAAVAADNARTAMLANAYSQKGTETEAQQHKRRLEAWEAVLKLSPAKMLEYMKENPGKSKQEVQEIVVNRILGQAPAVGAPSAIPNLDAFSVREKTGRQ